ncbi:MAG: DUF294 nucleotidyltransferase-like domain-containing protein [Chloroflexota bacterium]
MLIEAGAAIDEVVRFLKRVPPFQFLDDSTLESVADGLTATSYPKGTTILRQDGTASHRLQIIRKGAVRVFIGLGQGEEVVIDYRGEGDLIGYLSLFSDRSRANVVAEEDTLCYLISRETIRHLIDTEPAFGEFFLKSYLNIYIDKTFKEMHSKNLLNARGESILFTTPVGDLISRETVTAPHSTKIREAAEIMSREGISCLVILDSNDRPAGILTDSDLRDKVVAKGRDVNEPVKNVMSLPLIRVDDRDYCFEAVLKMVKYNVHHLLVVKSGNLKGVVTNHDLMLLQGTSPLSFTRDIESQHTIDGLATVPKKIIGLVALLLKEGAKAVNITRIITEIYDRLVRRILEIAEKELGPPPVPYCWVALGSEGRKEQTFTTDQDNAIILADSQGPEHAEETAKYFAAFTKFVRESLLTCGFPLCPHDFMASNPTWCQPLGTWKEYFSKWITSPLSEQVLNSVIFFDFRPIHGETGLALELRDFVASLAKDHTAFLGLLASLAARNRPPIGLLKTFVVEKSGEHKDQLDLETSGIEPLTDMVRLAALEQGVRETSTIERIDALRDRLDVVNEYANDLLQVFDFVMLLRIQHQLEQIRSDRTPDNFINPNSLSKLERQTLKEVFNFIAKLQDIVTDRHKEWPW